MNDPRLGQYQVLVSTNRDEGKRLDAFLSARLPHLSRRRVVRLIEEGAVRIDGHLAHKGSRLRSGQSVQVLAELVAVTRLQPNPDLPVIVLYEDPHFVAVSKPSGLPSHALHPAERRSVANFLLARYPEMQALPAGNLEAGLVHRLDRETSGVLVAARDLPSYQFLCSEFRNRRVRKGYWALVHGTVLKPATVRLGLEHDPLDRRKVRPSRGRESGREAVTHYWPIENFREYTLLRVEIETGVMHQIRAHLAHLGHPVVGDSLYYQDLHGLGRHFLHAAEVVVRHPANRLPLTISAPMPPEFETWLARLRSGLNG